MYYFLVILAGLLFSIMFLLTNRYQKFNGTSLKNGLLLALISNVVVAIFFLAKGSIAYREFHFSVTWLSALLIFLVALSSIGSLLLSILILKAGRMSYFSIFIMSGAIILPSVTGMIFFNEKVSALKIILIVVMVITCFFTANTVKQKAKSKKSILLLFAVFLVNGLTGCILTIYKYNPQLVPNLTDAAGNLVMDNDIYMASSGIAISILSFIIWVILAIKYRNNTDEKYKINKQYIWISVLLIPIIYGLACGIGNYLLAFSAGANALPVSVVYPISSGSTILFSALIGIIFIKEPLNARKIISLVIIIGCTIGFIFV